MEEGMRREWRGGREEEMLQLLEPRQYPEVLASRSLCLMAVRGRTKNRGRLPPSQRPLPWQSRVEVALQPADPPALRVSSHPLARRHEHTDLVPLQKENPGRDRGWESAACGRGAGGSLKSDLRRENPLLVLLREDAVEPAAVLLDVEEVELEVDVPSLDEGVETGREHRGLAAGDILVVVELVPANRELVPLGDRVQERRIVPVALEVRFAVLLVRRGDVLGPESDREGLRRVELVVGEGCGGHAFGGGEVACGGPAELPLEEETGLALVGERPDDLRTLREVDLGGGARAALLGQVDLLLS